MLDQGFLYNLPLQLYIALKLPVNGQKIYFVPLLTAIDPHKDCFSYKNRQKLENMLNQGPLKCYNHDFRAKARLNCFS